MFSSCLLSKPRSLLTGFVNSFKAESLNRNYAKRGPSKDKDDGCRRAVVDIPPAKDPICPDTCKRYGKKPGILHRIKMAVVEGGTNFGTPFRLLSCNEEVKKNIWKEVVIPDENEDKKKKKKKKKGTETKALALPKKVPIPIPPPRAGVQVTVLGADTAIGQYVALLLKQCPCIKKLRLYEAQDTCNSVCCRNLSSVCDDLHHINTNCKVEAYSCTNCDLERSLQNADIVLILESGYTNVDMSFEKRFCFQAPIVKQYTDSISTECPKAFVIVCASPIDCMVPIVAETLKETGWYDPRKVFGSLAVPEMRASTLAARALCLEPRYTRVPCVGGTEGEALVPLFSKAVEYFEFAQHNAMLMTDAVRNAPVAVTRSDGTCCIKQADLSEAHAISKQVVKIAHALLCHDIPRITGFVETDPGHVISPARYFASSVDVNKHGIARHIGLPKMSPFETALAHTAVAELDARLDFAMEWYTKFNSSSTKLDTYACHNMFFHPTNLHQVKDCAYGFM